MTSRHPMLSATTIMLALAPLLLTSCGKKSSVAVFPVRGSVLHNGKPAVGATVVFHPLDPANAARPRPQGVVASDGSFRLSSYVRDDGAPAGRYAVAILWPSDSTKDDDGTPVGPDRLGRRYTDPKTTPFQVEIQVADNDLKPFQLQ